MVLLYSLQIAWRGAEKPTNYIKFFSVKEIHFHPSSASGSKYVGMFFRDPEDM